MISGTNIHDTFVNKNIKKLELTVGPGTPIGPTGPGDPGAPIGPITPAIPGSPDSPWGPYIYNKKLKV